MTLVGRRVVVLEGGPFLLGRYPDRPAPAHLLNSFLRKAVGVGPRGVQVCEWARAISPDSYPDSLSETIRNDLSEWAHFRSALVALLDPDHRVFSSGDSAEGSPLALHGDFITSDSSDDGFGSGLWDIVVSKYPILRRRLSELTFPKEVDDAVSALAVALAAGGDERDQPGPQPAPDVAWLAEAGPLAQMFRDSICALVSGVLLEEPATLRSIRLTTLSKAVFLSSYFAAIRVPELIAYKPQTWGHLAPMFVYCGVPPGRKNDPVVRMACRAYDHLITAHRAALSRLVRERLRQGKRRVPRDVPPRQFARTLVRLAFAPTSQGSRHGAAALLDEIEQTVGQTSDLDKIAERLIAAVYPPGHLERGFRSMGRKIGLAGPDRGAGAPRLLFETPALALVVEATVRPAEVVEFDDWLDRVYSAFGLILGPMRQVDAVKLLGELESPALAHEILTSNYDLLRTRLIRSGLAIERSDAATEVFRPAPMER